MTDTVLRTRNPTREELVAELRASEPEFVREGVTHMNLFGSRARGEARERSDIDLAIEAPEAGRREWLDVCRLVEEEADTLLPIDLIRLEDVSEGLRARVRAEGQVLFER